MPPKAKKPMATTAKKAQTCRTHSQDSESIKRRKGADQPSALKEAAELARATEPADDDNARDASDSSKSLEHPSPAKSGEMDHSEETDEAPAPEKSSTRIHTHNKTKLDNETQKRVTKLKGE